MKCALCLLHPVHLLVAYNFNHNAAAQAAAAATTAGFKYFFLFNEQPVSFLCFNRHLHRIFFYLISAVCFIFFLFIGIVVVVVFFYFVLHSVSFIRDFCDKTAAQNSCAYIKARMWWFHMLNFELLFETRKTSKCIPETVNKTLTHSHTLKTKKCMSYNVRKRSREISDTDPKHTALHLSIMHFFSSSYSFFFFLLFSVYFFILFPFHPFTHTLCVVLLLK